ncbi:hypothetical protein ABPG74_004890 [Tetrahymena malaccensis]
MASQAKQFRFIKTQNPLENQNYLSGNLLCAINDLSIESITYKQAPKKLVEKIIMKQEAYMQINQDITIYKKALALVSRFEKQQNLNRKDKKKLNTQNNKLALLISSDSSCQEKKTNKYPSFTSQNDQQSKKEQIGNLDLQNNIKKQFQQIILASSEKLQSEQDKISDEYQNNIDENNLVKQNYTELINQEQFGLIQNQKHQTEFVLPYQYEERYQIYQNKDNSKSNNQQQSEKEKTGDEYFYDINENCKMANQQEQFRSIKTQRSLESQNYLSGNLLSVINDLSVESTKNKQASNKLVEEVLIKEDAFILSNSDITVQKKTQAFVNRFIQQQNLNEKHQSVFNTQNSQLALVMNSDDSCYQKKKNQSQSSTSQNDQQLDKQSKENGEFESNIKQQFQKIILTSNESLKQSFVQIQQCMNDQINSQLEIQKEQESNIQKENNFEKQNTIKEIFLGSYISDEFNQANVQAYQNYSQSLSGKDKTSDEKSIDIDDNSQFEQTFTELMSQIQFQLIKNNYHLTKLVQCQEYEDTYFGYQKCYKNLKQYENALDFSLQSLSMDKEIFQDKSFEVSSSLYQVAECYEGKLNNVKKEQQNQVNVQQILTNYENDLTKKRVENLLSPIVNHLNLSNFRIDLSNNPIGVDGALYLSQALKNLVNLQILEIKLSNNHIGMSGIQGILQAVQKCDKIYDLSLGLEENLISDKELIYLALTLEQLAQIQVLSLDLSKNNFGKEGIIALGSQLAKCKNLTSLSIDFSCCFSKEKPQNIGDILSSFVVELKYSKSLTNLSLNLLYLRIYDEGSLILAQSLQCLINLNKLSLFFSKNRISSVGIYSLGTSIVHLINLQKLHLNFWSSSINDESVTSLAQNLLKCQNLQSLELLMTNNKVADKGIFELANVLIQITSITNLSLVLDDNQISENGAIYLCKSLKKCIQIQNLNLELRGQEPGIYKIANKLTAIILKLRKLVNFDHDTNFGFH